LAVSAGKTGGTAPAVLSAADEVAVSAFLQGKISFMGIYRLVEKVLGEHRAQPDPDLAAITAADHWANLRASELADMPTG
jgi:1-deoxy-D-xylulose-5-phosphate reductoisomerase